ncbi:hypothetical protein LXL04_029615 [Taraxacum kok-saghyz]
MCASTLDNLKNDRNPFTGGALLFPSVIICALLDIECKNHKYIKMAQDLELDFEKYCVVDGSPKTVLLSPNHSKTEKKKVRKKSKCGSKVIISQNKEFTEISFNRYRSQSCRDVRSKSTRLGVNESLKRGSVYQSSKEVSQINSKETEGRKKIEFSRNSTPLPFDIFGSLCDSNEDDSLSRSFLETSINSIKKQEIQQPLCTKTPMKKSLSSRLELPHSPTKTPKNRFSPFKKMFDFDPFVKSKSQKSPLGFTTQEHDESKKDTSQKSLIHDFSNGHSNGILKVENKNQMPYFEFSLNNSNDVLVAKTSKVGNGCNWIYTFHTSQNRQKVNVRGHEFKDYKNKNKDPTKTVGQMRVSCYLCTELVNTGAFDNSMVTEFVLHDLEKKSTKSTNEKLVADLHLDLETETETAAIVVQSPSDMNIEKNEPARVSVVIPSANHGLPGGESRGPSPLLDRWRLGGGCECGGWDIGCPLVVLNNLNIHKEEPVKLFIKGTKEKTPALMMKKTEEGQYAVDFHEQLTSLQAFSICVAILHITETSTVVDHVKDREMLQCDSLRVFVEDEVKHLIESVVEEDKRKQVKNEIPASFLVNPPFSPMSRA